MGAGKSADGCAHAQHVMLPTSQNKRCIDSRRVETKKLWFDMETDSHGIDLSILSDQSTIPVKGHAMDMNDELESVIKDLHRMLAEENPIGYLKWIEMVGRPQQAMAVIKTDEA
eukprot:3568061-Amphidinium_carterae.1